MGSVMNNEDVKKDDYDRSIHGNPDANAWASFFMITVKKSNKPLESFIELDTMRGWFANAMMAMHDHIHNTVIKNMGLITDDLITVTEELTRLLEVVETDLPDNCKGRHEIESLLSNPKIVNALGRLKKCQMKE